MTTENDISALLDDLAFVRARIADLEAIERSIVTLIETARREESTGAFSD